MRYVLDTSVVIGGIPDYASEGAISVATLAELQFGILTATSDSARASRLLRFSLVNGQFRALSFNEEVAHAYAEMATAVKSIGRKPRSRVFDLIIAATARSQSVPLLTANPGDLKGIEHLVDVVSL